jgi:hypothetical protein
VVSFFYTAKEKDETYTSVLLPGSRAVGRLLGGLTIGGVLKSGRFAGGTSLCPSGGVSQAQDGAAGHGGEGADDGAHFVRGGCYSG